MSDAADDAPAAPSQRLLELQRLDSEIDQLDHRRRHLPEAAALADVSSELATWEATRDAMRAEIDRLGEAIVAAEERTADLGTDKERLEAQLKTVIAPREAEALMHEIQTIDEQRDEIETRELEALEAQASTEERLTGHLGAEATLRERVADANAAAEAATAEIDRDVAAMTSARDDARESVPAGLLGRYDRLRGHHQVAAATLDGRRCSGCHLDLSAAEVDDVKDEAAASDGVADCPQCGRMLIV